MKTCHWTMYNESGMNQVAKTMCAAERAMGIDAHIVNIQTDKGWDHVEDADVHISHTHFPDSMKRRLTKPLKLVWVGHGTPEHVYQSSVHNFDKPGWGAGDSLMLMLHFLRTADARVTFWPRHQAIYESLLPREAKVHCIPLGVDTAFWAAGESLGKYAGCPSVFTAENPHAIKSPFDLFVAWPWVYPHLPNACLHAMYVTQNLHRHLAPILLANGAAYGMHWGANVADKAGLRNIHKSTDFYIGLVQKGDFNCMSLEANASNGCRTISYTGNPYSDFWVPEGDQRVLAAELVKILGGDVEPRQKERAPDQSEMATAMLAIYEQVLTRGIA